MDQALVDRVAEAIRRNHEVGNDWNVCARNAICAVTDHIAGRQPWPAQQRKLADGLRDSAERAYREFAQHTQ